MADSKILFVCTGNTCRSPMAEGLFRKLVKDDPSIEVLGSAGVAAYPGDLISRETAELLKAEGADLENFKSREVSDELLEEATHVFAMTESHLDMLVGAFPDHAEKCYLVCDFVSINGQVGTDIPDPIGQGPKAYKMVADVFNQALPALLSALRQMRDSDEEE